MRKGMTPGRLVLRRFVRDRMAMTGLCLLAAIALFAFLGPLLSPLRGVQHVLCGQRGQGVWGG